MGYPLWSFGVPQCFGVSPMHFISTQQPCSVGPDRSILVTKDKGLQEYLGEVRSRALHTETTVTVVVLK